MFTKFSKWILYISSYIPLYIIFIASNLFDIYDNYVDLAEKNTYDPLTLMINSKINIILASIFLIIAIIFFILLLLLLRIAGKSSEFQDMYEIKKNNKAINEYVLVYILPFITVQTNNYRELTIFFIIFFLVGVLAVKNDLVYINPVLYIMKYNVYTFKENKNSLEESVLLSKYTILEINQNRINGTEKINMRASTLSNGVYYIKK